MRKRSTHTKQPTPRPVGRPAKQPGEAVKKYTACLKPSDREYLTDRYGNISEAIRHMIKGGRYEELQGKYERTLQQLRSLQATG